MLSDETRLLAEHWDAVDAIFAAETMLRKELSAFLGSLEDSLKQTKWWNTDWHFKIPDDQQVYIAHSRWSVKSEFALWIGVEEFNPRMLFGNGSVPQLYLWVKDKVSLTEELRSMVAEKKVILPGALAKKPQGYVVRRFIPKCLPPDIVRFEEFVRTPIVEFFSACADQEKLLSRAVERHLKNQARNRG